MPIKAAKSRLAKYWKGGLPISPVKLATAEGLTVEPFPAGLQTTLSGEVDGDTIRYNSSDSINSQRFTVAHELGHYVLGHGHAFRDPSEHFSMSYYDPREVAANKFAAEILMPEVAVKVLINQRKITDIKELARIFDVSINAMRYRLQSLGFM